MTWKVVTSGTLASNQFPLDSFLLDWILIASCAGEIYSLKRMPILIDQFCSTLSWAERKSMKKRIGWLRKIDWHKKLYRPSLLVLCAVNRVSFRLHWKAEMGSACCRIPWRQRWRPLDRLWRSYSGAVYKTLGVEINLSDCTLMDCYLPRRVLTLVYSRSPPRRLHHRLKQSWGVRKKKTFPPYWWSRCTV